MYKKNMNDIPANVMLKIFDELERQNLESVHMGYGSMLEEDDTLFAVIAKTRDANTYECYHVLTYDAASDKLIRPAIGLSYADALIEMGNRTKE